MGLRTLRTGVDHACPVFGAWNAHWARMFSAELLGVCCCPVVLLMRSDSAGRYVLTLRLTGVFHLKILAAACPTPVYAVAEVPELATA